ncbi:DNA/RNA non-specific endonuclease [Niallia sp. FSL W8-0951]|uniref:DNA/RNA non-specific endonuclease n=1 Tax=Niallia sp. FSL W8-0951 TaxID=2954639 RepID=UPI004046F829
MYVSGSAATSFLPYVGQAKYLKLLKGEKSKNKANEIRSAISQKTTKSLQRIDGSKKENSLWPNGIKNSGKQYVQEVTHFFRQNFMPNPSFQLSTANQAPINVWSRATIENRMDSIVPASLRKVEGKGTTKGTGNGNIVNEVKEIDFGKHIIKGENGKKQLLPNTKYVTNDNYKYTTDELGRIVNVDAPELVLKKANRNKYAQANVGGRDRLPDDDGGHLIGAQFNGPPDIDNLVPQNSQINRRGSLVRNGD